MADPDGAGGSISYQWYRNGAAIGGATAADYTTTQADVGKVMTVTADYTDDLSTVENLTSAGTAAVTNVNDAPVLGNNNLSISEGATVTLDSSMLSATDVDHPDASLIFNVSGVTAGYFALSSDPATPITSFDQSDITAGNVVFVHDGSRGATRLQRLRNRWHRQHGSHARPTSHSPIRTNPPRRALTF